MKTKALIYEGQLPRRAAILVQEWADLHNEELTENWNRAQHGQPLLSIPPLE
jgi:hypothetical protein